MINKPLRGFSALVGETIKKIDSRAINCVTILCESGKIVEIDSQDQVYGIPVVQCTIPKDVTK